MAPAWPSVAAAWRCFLSWPLRGLPWPPRGLTLLTLLPVLAPAWPSVAAAWPYFAHFALVLTPAWPSEAPAWPCFVYFAHAWPSVAAVWPYFAHFASCLGPCAWPCFAYFESLGLSVDPRGVTLLSLLPVLALAWTWPPAGWALAGLLSLLTLLPVSAPSWPSVAFSWPSCTSCLGPCVALCGPSVGITCFAVFHTCATLGLTRLPMVWPVSWLHLVSGRLEPQASAGGGSAGLASLTWRWPRTNQPTNQPHGERFPWSIDQHDVRFGQNVIRECFI